LRSMESADLAPKEANPTSRSEKPVAIDAVIEMRLQPKTKYNKSDKCLSMWTLVNRLACFVGQPKGDR
jgi:hypothetical protein